MNNINILSYFSSWLTQGIFGGTLIRQTNNQVGCAPMKKHFVNRNLFCSTVAGPYISGGGRAKTLWIWAHRHTPIRVHLIKCHIIIRSINGVPIKATTSHGVGHAQLRVSRNHYIPPNTEFDSSIHNKQFVKSYELLPLQLSHIRIGWSFCEKRCSVCSS